MSDNADAICPIIITPGTCTNPFKASPSFSTSSLTSLEFAGSALRIEGKNRGPTAFVAALILTLLLTVVPRSFMEGFDPSTALGKPRVKLLSRGIIISVPWRGSFNIYPDFGPETIPPRS